MDRCAACGFDVGARPLRQLPDALVAEAERLGSLLAEVEDPAVRRDRTVWSPLEYACHVRDVLLVQRERTLLALRDATPTAAPMGRDERVVHDRYAEQDPLAVARQLVDAASMLSHTLRGLDDRAWSRTILYGYPNEAERDLRWLAAHTLHEVVHHRGDVERQGGRAIS